MALTTIKTGGLADNSVTDAKVADAITITGAQTGITQVGTLTALTGGTGDLIWDSPTFVVDSSASRVGIGTASPQQPIHIHNAGVGSTSYIQFTQDGTGATSGDGSLVGVSAAEDLIVYNAESTNTILYTGAAERMRIDSSGKVGIGSQGSTLIGYADAAANNLVVGSSTGDEGITIISGASAGDYGALYFGDANRGTNGRIMYEQNNEIMSFYTNNTEKMRIALDGSVVINNSGSDGALYFGGTSGTNRMYLARSGGDALLWNVTAGNLKLGTNNALALTIDSSQHAKFAGKIEVGTFSQSTTNAGEAWIGRATDREDGTLTVQLGGNADTGTKFEIVDRAWSKVIFQVSGEAPSGAFNLNSSGTIATQSNVSGDYAMFVNQVHSTGWGLRIAGGADSGDYIIRGQNGSGNDRFLVTSDGALEIRNNMLIERSIWDEPQIRLDPSSNYEFRIGNYGTSSSKKFGIKNNDGTIIMESSGNNGNSFWFGGDVSAASFTDRTPYPETLKIAYDVLASHKKLDDYDKNDKEHQLDHTKLHDFAKPQITVSTGLPEDEVVTKELGQDGRDASAVISCLVEVVNDLTAKVTALENA